MRFRLIYSGELRATQRSPLPTQKDKLATHKHGIRQQFHKQLGYLWQTDWFLRTSRVWPQDYGFKDSTTDHWARWAPDQNQMVPLVDVVAETHRAHGYRFVPLVRKEWRLLCNLEIMFLRHDPPGSVVSAGDLDNRVKTIVDTLTMPASPNQLSGHDTPAPDEDPFFCLLEDDQLVSGLTVTTDRLLVPPSGPRDEDNRRVHVPHRNADGSAHAALHTENTFSIVLVNAAS